MEGRGALAVGDRAEELGADSRAGVAVHIDRIPLRIVTGEGRETGIKGCDDIGFEGRVARRAVVCPHCGTLGNSTLLQGKSTRAGLYKCKDCRKPFTATMGTVYERSHIPLHRLLLATHLV